MPRINGKRFELQDLLRYASAFVPVGQRLGWLHQKRQLALRLDNTLHMPSVHGGGACFIRRTLVLVGARAGIESIMITRTSAMHNGRVLLGPVNSSCNGCATDEQKRRVTVSSAANNLGARRRNWVVTALVVRESSGGALLV